ncbi:hypothetical protein BD414DRAFT_499684 [Trametes punicea]|nr:hypothetical protein BD414DRAFT_499684 [Trametes punicea]
MSSQPSQPNSGFNSIFQSAGGPPLILVCIAAGLLFGAFIGMLIMKRFRPSVIVQRVNRASGDDQGQLGEKPKLFDVHLRPIPEDGGGGGDSWAYTSPFAAVYLPSASDRDDDPGPATQPARTPSPLSRLMARLRSHARSDKGNSTPSPPRTPELRRVQLAFAVSMPDPAHSGSPKGMRGDNAHEDDCHDQPVPDCCIGTTILPYRPGPV